MASVAKIGRQTATLAIPSDAKLLAAIGAVAIAHGQLEYVLRMTIKTLSGLTTKEALDATQFMSTSDTRKEVRKLFAGLVKDNAQRLKLDALLERARRESQKRNELLHRPLALDAENNWLTKDEFHAWGPIPGVEKFDEFRERIYDLIKDLNEARLNGFISEATKQNKANKQENI